jgi:sterol desaturase/sphingolipid hydroxylase (fatty acid hydroxylase superfamily)
MSDSDFQTYKGIALLIAFVVVFVAQTLFPYRGSVRQVLGNSRLNLSLAMINFVIVNLVCAGCVCSLAIAIEERGMGLTNWARGPLWTRVLISVVLLDFVAFGWHWANHRVRLLWRFHAVHHTDNIFDASTAFRFHPGELLISLGVRLGIVATFGLPVYGILLFEMIYGLANTFEHGNIRCASTFERALSLIFVTPSIHRKHHSRNVGESNRNFGTIFSFWDKCFGTYLPSSSAEQIDVGVSEHIDSPLGLRQLISLPLMMR